MTYITSSGAQAVGLADGILIQVNAALTGTLTVTYAGSTQYGTTSGTIAVITNPTVGSQYKYSGLRTLGIISVNPNGSTDITVSRLNQLM